jgi:hypothetical protein
MSFFTNLVSTRGQASATASDTNLDANMIEIEEGNRALVLYNSRETIPGGFFTPPTPSKRHETPDSCSDDESAGAGVKWKTPFTPSKRQYREVDKSVSLRERNRTLIATNKALLQQQMDLAQRAEEAAEMARQSQRQHESDMRAMQLAQQKFQEEMSGKYQAELAKLKVSYITRRG